MNKRIKGEKPPVTKRAGERDLGNRDAGKQGVSKHGAGKHGGKKGADTLWPKQKTEPVRKVAVEVLAALYKEQGSLSSLLPEAAEKVNPSEQSLLQEMVFGVCRWSSRLELQLAPLMAKPLRNKDSDVKMLLMLGLYQLDYMRIADHAVLNETVSTAKALRKDWARGLVNAVLRSHQRNKEPDNAEASSQEVSAEAAGSADAGSADVGAAEMRNEVDRFAHPRWMIDKIRMDWPEHWQQILDNANERPPLTLRVNQRLISVSDWMDRLSDHAGQASRIAGVQQALILDPPMPVNDIPGFADGQVSVQDGAAQLAVQLLVTALERNARLPSEASLRLLDACAAPGGKTGYLLEAMEHAAVWAVDNSESRLTRVVENLTRLKLQERAHLCTADAASAVDHGLWWDGTAFDAMLLDVPCSGSGVIRRQPDIKILRHPDHLDELVKTQNDLLNNLWPKLKTGGLLLYATCSIFREENEARIEQFLGNNADAREFAVTSVIPQMPAGQACAHGWQLLTGDAGMDGFYFCLLEKSA